MTAFGGALSINISPTAKVMTNRSTSAMRSCGQSMENSLMSSWARGSLRSLDVKSASAYSSGRRLSSSTTTSTGRSFIDASYMISRARSREWCRWTPSSLTLGPGHVFTCARVDLDEFSGSDEQRYLHDEPGLERRGLSCARHTAPLDTGLGLGDCNSTAAGNSTPVSSSACRISIALPVSLRKLAAPPRLLEDTDTWS